MAVVASVAINVDSRGAAQKLRQFQQQSTAAGRAAEQLQGATGKVGREMQTAANGMRFFIDAAGRARKENGQFVTTAEAAAAGLEKQGKAARNAAGALRGVGGAIASIGAGALVAGMVRGAASAEQLQLRLKLLSKEYGETERVQQFVAQSAKTFGQSQTEAASGVADVYARLRPLGTTLDQIQVVYNGFNAVALASGVSAEAASGAFLQLSQALGSGTLQGDEFRSIAEQVPGILRLVSSELGVSVGELKKLGSEGKITSDVLINALARGFDENQGKIQELLALSPAQRFKEFRNATQELSNALGSELLPALTPIVQTATEILRLFGQLPGPVKTLAAAVLGLTAAFVALAPAINAVLALAGTGAWTALLAAGPWIALAAGITVAVGALASYRSEAEKLAGAAAAGGAPAVAAARNAAAQKGQEISLLEQQRKTATGRERASIDRRLATLRGERTNLLESARAGDVAGGTGAAAAAALPAGGDRSRRKGKTDAEKAAERAAKEEARIQSRIRGLQIETQATQQLAVLRGRIAEAEMAGNEELAIRLRGVEREQQILVQYQQSIGAVTDERVRQAMEAKALADLEMAGMETAIDLERQRLKLLKEQNDEFFKRAGLTPQDKMPSGAGAFDPSLPDLRVSPAEQQMATYRAELDALTNPINMAVTGANAIGDAFGQAFQDIATGAKSTEQALADTFKAIGEAFISMAVQIIAKQIAMITFQTLLKALGGGGSFSFSGAGPYQLPGGDGFAQGFSLPKLNATGSMVTGPTNAIIGEAGPEAVMPLQRGTDGKMGVQIADNRAFLDSLTTGFAAAIDEASDDPAAAATDNRASLREVERLQENRTQIMTQQMEAERRYERERIEQMASTPGNLNIKYESQVINNVEYVTRDQAERMAAQSALRGRELAIGALQNSVKTRKRVGI